MYLYVFYFILQRIDLNSNPIAFITCSLVFIVYIVAVFVCRKMDQLDLDRISVVPLCGKDGSFKYEITVVTGRKMGAGKSIKIFHQMEFVSTPCI